MKDFETYWEDYSDYNTEEIAAVGPVAGHRYNYVSSTLLDGFINYVEPLCGFVMERYRKYDPAELEKALAEFHTKLGSIRNDVVLLGRVKGTNVYWYFWYDCDVSDCSVGRFVSDDDPQVISESFRAFVRGSIEFLERPEGDVGDCITGAFEFDVSRLRGWISF